MRKRESVQIRGPVKRRAWGLLSNETSMFTQFLLGLEQRIIALKGRFWTEGTIEWVRRNLESHCGLWCIGSVKARGVWVREWGGTRGHRCWAVRGGLRER